MNRLAMTACVALLGCASCAHYEGSNPNPLSETAKAEYVRAMDERLNDLRQARNKERDEYAFQANLLSVAVKENEMKAAEIITQKMDKSKARMETLEKEAADLELKKREFIATH